MRLRNQCNIYNSYEEWIGEIDESDLHVVALSFRLLRQQGFYVSSGHFRVHHEKILDEAVNFTTTHLKIMLPKLSNSLSMQINNARKWWKELNLAKVLPFIRDRIVELYSWSLGVYFEPQYKLARKILTKAFCFASITDDIYDTYGKLYELTLLTNAIERWNIDAAQELPSYMKLYYTALLDVYTEAEKDLAKENKSFRVNYAILAREVERGDVTGVQCYMNEYGVTKEEANVEIKKIILNCWKDLNRQCLKPTRVPRFLLMPVLNLARMCQFAYIDEDANTFSKNNYRDFVSMVLVDPIKA
ncbi:putative deacetylvindoline O-acetyltransferase-like [Capsicum annuum]|nr:putative deacetylvindoline O-acetyltransferase-like [Capsicum annuum]